MPVGHGPTDPRQTLRPPDRGRVNASLSRGPRACEETPPRCGAILAGVKRLHYPRVPRSRPAPDGGQSGGTNPRRSAGSPVASDWLRLFPGTTEITPHADLNTLQPTLDSGSHINATAQRWGQNAHRPQIERLSCNAPLAPRPLQCVVSAHNPFRGGDLWKKLGASGALWHRGRRRGSASQGRRFLGAFNARWFAGLRCPGGGWCGGRPFSSSDEGLDPV